MILHCLLRTRQDKIWAKEKEVKEEEETRQKQLSPLCLGDLIRNGEKQ